MNNKDTYNIFMSNHKLLCALAVTVIVGASNSVPVYAQQRISLQTLFVLADQQSQRIKVSEIALKAAEEGIASAKSALLPSVELSVQGSYTGNAFLMSRGGGYQWHNGIHCARTWSSAGTEWQTANTALGQQLHGSGKSSNLRWWCHPFGR